MFVWERRRLESIRRGRRFGASRPSSRAAAVLLAVIFTLVWAGSAWSPAGAIEPPATSTTLRPPPPLELPSFQLPYAAGSAYLVAQGNAGPYTHETRGPAEFAWDFQMGEGTMLVAAAPGRVVAVESRMSGGGLSDRYAGHANYVLVAHADGRYSLYLHLAQNGALVTPGQRVDAGEGLGLSGSTGFSSGPHLHFQVQGAELPRVGQSVPIAFAGVGVPTVGTRPVSQNRHLPSPPEPTVESSSLLVPATGREERVSLLTYQRQPVSVGWAAPGGPPAAAGTAPPTPVRLRTLDAAGTVEVAASGTAEGTLTAEVATATAGWLAVWAEYFDGERWRVCADAEGRPVASVLDVAPASVFLAEPGLAVRAAAAGNADHEAQAEVEVRVDEMVEARFRVENVGATAIRLLGVGAELAGPAGTFVPEQGGRDMYLRPGESGAWSGTFRPTVSGVFTLRPLARDAAGKAVALAPRTVGRPAVVRVKVLGPGDGPGRGDGDPGGGAPGDAPPAFADVPAGHPAYEAVQRLAARGVVSGYVEADGRYLFRPDEPVTRAQFAKMLVGTVGLPVAEGGAHPFLDVERSGPAGLYPDDYIAAAFAAGLLRGVSMDPPRFAPRDRVTRRQVVLVAGRAGLDAPSLPGDQWAPAPRGEVALLLARLLPE